MRNLQLTAAPEGFKPDFQHFRKNPCNKMIYVIVLITYQSLKPIIMRLKQIVLRKDVAKVRRNYPLAIYIAFVSAFMVSYSLVTAIQYF